MSGMLHLDPAKEKKLPESEHKFSSTPANNAARTSAPKSGSGGGQFFGRDIMPARSSGAFSAFDSDSGQTLSPIGAGLVSGMSAAPIQAKKNKAPVSRGDLLRQDFEAADLAGQVRLMSDYSRMSSLTNDTDRSEDAVVNQILSGVGPDFMEELLRQQLEAGTALNQIVKPDQNNMPGFHDFTMASAQRSDEANRFQSYSTLLMNIGMNSGNEQAFDYFRDISGTLMQNDEGAHRTLSDAQNIIMHGDDTAWAKKNAAGLKTMQNREAFRNSQFVDQWHAGRNQRAADANQGGFFSRLFRRRR